jgi:preprotein translocase subunit Sss1
MDEQKIINFIEEVKRMILGGRKPKEEDETLSEFEYARRYSKTNSMAQE